MVTQEDLEKMSPEEIKQLQIQNCIFCKIISGEIPSKKIYQDDECIVILDINPASSGHLLVLPKKHESVFPLLEKSIQKHCFMIAKQLSECLIKTFQVSGTSIFVANGAVAGQKSPHCMIHVLPRNENDNLFSLPKNPISSHDLKKLQLILRQAVSKILGVEDSELASELRSIQENSKKQEVPVKKDDDKADLDKISGLF